MTTSLGSPTIAPTLMPSTSDSADIQAAFQAYHWGGTTEPTVPISTGGGITGAIYRLQNSPNFVGTISIGGTTVLNATTLGTGIVNSSLTKVGALSGGTAGLVFIDASGNLTSASQLPAPSYLPNISTNAQTGTAYTLVLSDNGKMIEVSNTSAITLTIPLNSSVAFPIGTQINILQTNTGQITVAGTGGVTVNATPGLKLRTQWSSATLIKRATDTWVLVGDIVA